ncbi:hypothetical protein PAHAL_2G333400 [Panicum hallii]|uniref:Uncharacterized protein n=1 Tax=Panicum hallii TaxID=206008 RepID=A0A2T8KRD3_9POAL|nr:hypothetical protein PAHAL_2G333400 [Panicum hallii]
MNLDLKSTIATFCNTMGESSSGAPQRRAPGVRRRPRRRWLWRRPAGRGCGSSMTPTGWCSRIRRRRGGRPGRGAPAGADLLCAPPPRCSVAASPAMRSPRSRSGPAPRSPPQPRPLPSCPPPAAAAVLVHRGARVGRAAGQRGEAPEGGQPARELRLITEPAIIPAQFSQLNRISVI